MIEPYKGFTYKHVKVDQLPWYDWVKLVVYYEPIAATVPELHC